MLKFLAAVAIAATLLTTPPPPSSAYLSLTVAGVPARVLASVGRPAQISYRGVTFHAILRTAPNGIKVVFTDGIATHEIELKNKKDVKRLTLLGIPVTVQWQDAPATRPSRASGEVAS